MEQNLQDVRVSGAGKISGGKYRNVKISGAGTISGDVECISFETSGASNVNGSVNAKEVTVSGASNINGDVKATEVKLSGASEIKGNLDAEEIRISGGSDIKGNITTKKIKVSGASHIRGNLQAEEVEVSGSVEIKEDCEAENFRARGGFEIGGLLNAGNVEVSIYGRCRVREIGGEKIDIRKGTANILESIIKYIFVQGERLTTSVIEGDDVYLEATTAKIVRGNNVTIGPDCNIDAVEYRNTISIAQDSTVKTQKNI